MKKDVRPRITNETSAAAYTGLAGIATDARFLRMDAVDIKAPARKMDKGAAFSHAGAIRRRSS